MNPDPVTVADIARTIDHSMLRPEMTVADLVDGCTVARDYKVVTVCVRPTDLQVVARELDGSGVRLTTVIGFPHGSHTTRAKVFEAGDAIGEGAVEVDVVSNIGRMCSGDHDYVRRDIAAVVKEAHGQNALVKVIFENCYLTDEQKVTLCRICEDEGADFVKTSTGYGKTGATISDLILMRKTCPPQVKVKAAGGVSTLDAALAVLATGAVRIGTRSTKIILEEAKTREAAGNLVVKAGAQLDGGY